MNRPKLLDLFCGAGGASMGYYRAGFDVVGVDIKPQPHYPFKFYLADALTFPLEGYDAYHASPPCQLWTKKNKDWGRKRVSEINYPDLLTPIRERLKQIAKPYVLENVNGAPLNGLLMLCGTMFGLKIIKHRFFEYNFEMPFSAPFTCNHKGVYNPWQGKNRSADKFREATDIDWMPCSGGASRKAGYTGDLSNAIPPTYTEYIGKYLLEAVKQGSIK